MEFVPPFAIDTGGEIAKERVEASKVPVRPVPVVGVTQDGSLEVAPTEPVH